jgi:hypothetical protein
MNQPFRKDPPLDLPGGNLFKRMIAAKAIAGLRRCKPEDVAMDMWPNDRMLAAAYAMKATSTPAMTSVSGWAKELAAIKVADAVEALGAASSAVEVMSESLLLSWDGFGAINVPAFVAAAANSGFVQEGSPIPVRQFTDSSVQLLPYKVASISALTREMMEGSNAETFITNALVGSSALAIDAAFFDSSASSASRPAGIRNGISTITASNNSDPFAAAAEDIAAVINGVGAVGGTGPFILVCSAGRFATLTMRFVAEDSRVIIIPSNAVGNDIIAIAPQAIAAAVDPDPEVEVVDAGVLVMDTAPGAAGTTGAAERSLFQTDSLAIKVRWPVSWMVRDSRGVAWTTPSWK